LAFEIALRRLAGPTACEGEMADAKASIGVTDYAVAIMAGNHRLIADESVDRGGKDTGPSPSELACAALCACTAITLRIYAERKEWSLQAVQVSAHLSQDDGRHVITRTLGLEGDLNDEQRARLADIAERTPVTLLLKEGAKITTTLAPSGRAL
jgi:putative redox protein